METKLHFLDVSNPKVATDAGNKQAYKKTRKKCDNNSILFYDISRSLKTSSHINMRELVFSHIRPG